MNRGYDSNQHRMIYTYNPDIGHLYVPNQFIRIHNPQKAYFVRTNSSGFRSNKEFRYKCDEKHRIIFLGDSHTAGDGAVCNEERFSDIIESRYSNCSSYNFALGGSGMDQQVLIYEKIASEYEHDIICFCFHQKSDLSRLVPELISIDRNTGLKIRKPKPYFDIETMQFLNIPVPKIKLSTNLVKTPSQSSGSSKNTYIQYLKKSIYRCSPFGNHPSNRLGKEFIRRSNYPLLLREYVESLRRFKYNRKYLDRNGYYWKAIELLLNRLVEKSNGRTIILCPLVDPIGGNPDLSSIYTNITTLHPEVIYINLQEKLKQVSRKDRWDMYNKTTWHYNEKGHAFISECICEEIDKGHLVSKKVHE